MFIQKASCSIGYTTSRSDVFEAHMGHISESGSALMSTGSWRRTWQGDTCWRDAATTGKFGLGAPGSIQHGIQQSYIACSEEHTTRVFKQCHPPYCYGLWVLNIFHSADFGIMFVSICIPFAYLIGWYYAALAVSRLNGL